MKVPNQYRIKDGPMGSNDSYGNNGCFVLTFESMEYVIIASDGDGWDHVSVSTEKRTPRWEAMCYIKDLFFEPEDCVVQYHPPQSEYVNNHPHCLHLWKPQNIDIPTPPTILV